MLQIFLDTKSEQPFNDQPQKLRKTSVLGGVSFFSIPLHGTSFDLVNELNSLEDINGPWMCPPSYLMVKRVGLHPRAGIVPGAGKNGMPRVVMTMNTLDLSGSDVFKSMYGMQTDDLGKSWTEPKPLEALALRHETISGTDHPVAATDFWPQFHKATQTLLGTGHTIVYTPDWEGEKSSSPAYFFCRVQCQQKAVVGLAEAENA